MTPWRSAASSHGSYLSSPPAAAPEPWDLWAPGRLGGARRAVPRRSPPGRETRVGDRFYVVLPAGKRGLMDS